MARMDPEQLTTGGVITLLGGVLIKLLSRWAKAETEAKIAVAATMAKIADGQRADNVRVIDTMIAQARTDGQFLASIEALRITLTEAVESRRRDGDAVLAAVKDLEREIADLAERIANLEDRRPLSGRPRRSD